jgi:hypothetical protein
MTRPASRLAYGLLAVMTAVSFGGPLVIMIVLAGGESPKWPPDRPIEWTVFVGIVGLASLLLLLGLTIRLWLPRLESPDPAAGPEPSPIPDVDR